MIKDKETVDSVYVFTKLDRCDGCSAQAYVRIYKNKMELLFCGHHYNRFAPQLLIEEWSIDDQTDILHKEVAAMKKPSDNNF